MILKLTFQGKKQNKTKTVKQTKLHAVAGTLFKKKKKKKKCSIFPRVKQLSFTVFESIQPISGSGDSIFLA